MKPHHLFMIMLARSSPYTNTSSSGHSPDDEVRKGQDKLKIIKENRGRSGVYRITNLLTGKSYIGSSIDLGRRFMNYYSVNSLLKATGMAICRALLKYGYSSFKL